MAGLNIGSSAIAKVASGAAEVLKISRGETLIWQAVTFIPAGMTKAAPEFNPNSSSPVLVTGWTPDAGSTVASNGLVVNGAKDDATITAVVKWRSTATSGTYFQADLRVGSVVVASVRDVAGQSGDGTKTTTLTGLGAVREGDLVTLYVWDTYTSYVRVLPDTRITVS